LAVTLDAPTALSALTVHGPARGTLSAFAKEKSGLRPIAGWTHRKIDATNGQWLRVDATEKVVSAEVVLRWTSADQSTPGEIGLWANKAAGASFTDEELADQLLSATPVDAITLPSPPSEARVLTTAAGPMVFRAHFDRDPRVVGRAFLVYELA